MHPLCTAFLLSLAALCAGCADPYPLDDELRVDHLQVIGTHNSYHVMTGEIDPWAYTHAPLDEQIRDLGVRQFELDAWWDKDTERWLVFHVPALDEGTTCETLRDCFQAQADGAAEVEGHVPIVTLLELKSGGAGEDWRRLNALVDDLTAVWSEEQLLTPRQVQGDAATLAEAVANGGWPTLREARGKMIYVLHAGDAWRAVLTADDTTVGSTPLFAEAGGDLSCTACAVQTVNDPTSERMAPALAAGQLVRTRADADNEEALAGDPTRRDQALASGAHAVSTDWPAAHPDTGYIVRLEGDLPARCNPVTAPAVCTAEALEIVP